MSVTNEGILAPCLSTDFLTSGAAAENTGGGVFQSVKTPPITSSSSGFTNAVAWGDMDGDGDLMRR